MSDSNILSNRNFLLLWTGNAISNVGLKGVQIAYPLLALILTGSPIVSSIVAFAMILPMVIFEIPAGVVADHWNHRRVLLACQRMGLVATLLAAIVIIMEPPGLPLFLTGAAFAEGTAYVFFNTSELILIRDIVTEDERPGAFAFFDAEQHIANIIGRSVGAAAVGIARTLPFLANALSYLYCLWTLSKIRDQAPAKSESESSNIVRIWDWRHFRVGMQMVWDEPMVRGGTIALAVANAILQVFVLLITLDVRASGHSAWAVGVVLGATGLGGLLGAVPAASLASRISPRIAVTVMVWVWVFLCMTMVASSNLAALTICWMGVGFVVPLGNIPLTLYRLRAFPDELVGRVFGATKLIAHSGGAAGALLAGPLLSTLGTATTGWGLVAGMVLLARYARRLPERPPAASSHQRSVGPPPATWITRASRNILENP
ncbi:MFS transporter [Nocardia sp. NBC_01327]|uniref:MFS transporter n=1 Tax=Nocardia sp. NBC_01327 TaxID=2903593 RepID=UPI002E167883|nr:MFS transporter [Nocardia sp. NBC_01327]